MIEGGLDRRVTLISMSAIAFLFAFSNYMFGLPIVDFRPYKVGNDIGEDKSIPDEYELWIWLRKQRNRRKSISRAMMSLLQNGRLYTDTNTWDLSRSSKEH